MTNPRTLTERWADMGQLLALFSMDKRYNMIAAQSLIEIVIPPVNLGHYAIARRTEDQADGQGTLAMPMGAMLIARVSDEVDDRLRQAGQIPQLQADEWDSGPHAWVIHAPGDPQAVGKLLDKVHRTQLGGGRFSAFIATPDGKVSIRDFG